MTVSARWGSASDGGLVRERNEDALLASVPVFAVADGMGGHAAGDVASATVIAGLRQFEGASAVAARSVILALQEANKKILRRSLMDHNEAGMGSTVVGIALSRDDSGDVLLVFNIGDSRVYLCREGLMEQLSRDHSVVAELVEQGSLTPDEARTDGRRNIITRGLGLAELVEVDEWIVAPAPGDRYLLCSDGLTDEVRDTEIAEVLRHAADPDDAARTLVRSALDAGGHDNVTVLVVDIDGVDAIATGLDDDTESRPDSDDDTDERR